MKQLVLKAKLHCVIVTHSEPDYDGSCAIDDEWLALSGIHPHEQIHVHNLTNGERFVTYAISAGRGSAILSVNGAAAHKANPGDKVTICAYTEINELEMTRYKSSQIFFDHNNPITYTTSGTPSR